MPSPRQPIPPTSQTARPGATVAGPAARRSVAAFAALDPQAGEQQKGEQQKGSAGRGGLLPRFRLRSGHSPAVPWPLGGDLWGFRSGPGRGLALEPFGSSLLPGGGLLNSALHDLDALMADAADFSPRLDAVDAPDATVLRFDVPGLDISDLTLETDEDAGTVKLSGETRSATEEQAADGRWAIAERSHGMFVRSVKLPADAKLDDLSASLDKGVLTVHVPRTMKAQAPPAPTGKKVPISEGPIAALAGGKGSGEGAEGSAEGVKVEAKAAEARA